MKMRALEGGRQAYLLRYFVIHITNPYHTATHLVEYKEKETKTKKLVGKAASELSSEKYGPEEWWLLLEPIA